MSSIADRIESRVRSLFTSHVEPRLIAEISPEMLERLRRDTLRGILCLPLVMLGAFSAVNWLYGLTGVGAIEGRSAVAFWVIVIVSVIMTFPACLRSLLDREVEFRRQHGKWRWEH
jgi:anti-sigma factor RsiW